MPSTVTWTLSANFDNSPDLQRTLDRVSAEIEEAANREALCVEIIDLTMEQEEQEA